MEDDNTIKLTKGDGSNEFGGDSSKIGSTSSSPELSTLFQSSKEIASLESSANFRSISTSSDLKALLPQREMKWRTLDKYGRRVQKMKDDGADNFVATRSESDVNTESDVKTESDTSTSPPLSELLQATKEISGYEEAEKNFREFNGSSDLKALLPKRKMTWMKLDKLGRRVERMEDDGTVNKRVGHGVDADEEEAKETEEPAVSSQVVAVEGMLPDDDATDSQDEVEFEAEIEPEMNANEQFLVDLLKVGDNEPEPTPKSSKNLKDLLSTTKKPTWTKLDHWGVGVEDTRRTKAAPVTDSSSKDSNLKTLLMQSKKPTWTKLDFKGVGVPDEKRSKQQPKDEFNKGQYTNLKTLLPERKIQWGTRGKVVSISDGNVDIDGSDPNKGVSLKTLLPEKKVTWRNEEAGGTK